MQFCLPRHQAWDAFSYKDNNSISEQPGPGRAGGAEGGTGASQSEKTMTPHRQHDSWKTLGVGVGGEVWYHLNHPPSPRCPKPGMVSAASQILRSLWGLCLLRIHSLLLITDP